MASPYSIALITITITISFIHTTGYPVFSVKYAAVKAYNLTSDNRLFCILIFHLRALNPNTGLPLSYGNIEVHVNKGRNDHTLADDVVPSFSQPPSGETLIMVEAVALYRRLDPGTAAALRVDHRAGSVRLNVYASGSLGRDHLDVKCQDVVVKFEPSNGFAKRVCDVNVDVAPPPAPMTVIR